MKFELTVRAANIVLLDRHRVRLARLEYALQRGPQVAGAGCRGVVDGVFTPGNSKRPVGRIGCDRSQCPDAMTSQSVVIAAPNR